MIGEIDEELDYSRWSVGHARDVLVLEDHEVEPLIQELRAIEPAPSS